MGRQLEDIEAGIRVSTEQNKEAVGVFLVKLVWNNSTLNQRKVLL